MASGAPTAIDDELRGILESLTEGMFPLAAWIGDKVKNGRYKPHEHVPWRDNGRSLAPKDMGAVQFFQELLEQSVHEAPLAVRFAEVAADPLRFSPLLKGAPAWRASRKLDPTPQFG